jgi:hypothetical protein
LENFGNKLEKTKLLPFLYRMKFSYIGSIQEQIACMYLIDWRGRGERISEKLLLKIAVDRYTWPGSRPRISAKGRLGLPDVSKLELSQLFLSETVSPSISAICRA